jgi:hypothetical protein
MIWQLEISDKLTQQPCHESEKSLVASKMARNAVDATLPATSRAWDNAWLRCRGGMQAKGGEGRWKKNCPLGQKPFTIKARWRGPY